jgi:signal transduction histidine kinase
VFRATHIRTKLGVALAVPLVGLVAMAGFEVMSAADALGATRSQTELATASVGPGSLITRLQDERNRAAIDLIGLGAAAGLPVATNAEARGLVDTSVTELKAQLDGRGTELTNAFAPAWKALGSLKQLRADIDAYSGPMDLSNHELADQVFTRYTNIVESFFDATSTVARAVDDANLRNGVDLVDAAARQSEVRARIVRSVVLATVAGNGSSPAAGQDVSALYDRGRVLDKEIRTDATGPYAGIADATFAEAGVQSFNSQVEAFLTGQPVNITEMLGAVKSQPDIGYLGLRTRAAEALGNEADRVERGALDHQKLFAGLGLATLALALFLTWLASRSVTRPLASLRRQAEDMAGTRLPTAVRQILETPAGEDVVIPEMEAIRVKSRDEVAEVAAALSAVQTSALDLAVEQAVLRRNISDSYINLGRRNQNLLSRQLDFITDLERNESDPDTLEGLFRLDHLATRMRRNAESLLVLAGVEAPRQWSAPVKLSDVVRAALGEVEDYQRVIIRHLEPAAVTGAVAADIAHVTAELIENALSFSPQDQQVEVKGRLTVDGYTLAISDNGYGMSPEDLDRANRRLAGAESFTVAPSRYLGHYVAGHLATRLGVVVELHDSPAGGVTARVDVPMGLLANEETDPRLAAFAQPASSSDAVPAIAPAPARETSAPMLTATMAPEPPELTDQPAPEPAPTASPSFTTGGLPRRGERPAAGIDLDAPSTGSADAASASGLAAPTDVTAVPPTAWVLPGGHGPAADQTPPPDLQTPDLPMPAHMADPLRPEPAIESPTPDLERGFGGLAVTRPTGPSLYSVAAQNARNGAAARPGGPQDTTATGLTRRVPGAQRPDAAFGAARSSEPAPTASEPQRSTPEDVYSFLSSFQSGVARGLADAHDDAQSPEDDR